MNDRSLERMSDSAKSTIDKLISKIESLESELEEANETIDKLQDRIEDILM